MPEKEEGNIASLNAKLSHKELEKEDMRIETKIDVLIESVAGLNEKVESLKTKVDFTNGKVRAHQVWIASLVGGGVVLLFLGVFLRDVGISLVAQAVIEQLNMVK